MRFANTDACVALVLSLTEATADAHNQQRELFGTTGNITQPSTAPRFDRTPPDALDRAPYPGEHTRSVLATAGYDQNTIDALIHIGAVRSAGTPG